MMEYLDDYQEEFFNRGRLLFNEVYEGCESDIAYMLAFSLYQTMKNYGLEQLKVNNEIIQSILDAFEFDVTDDIERGMPSYNDFVIEVLDQFKAISPTEFGGLQTLRTFDASEQKSIQEEHGDFTEKSAAINPASERFSFRGFVQKAWAAIKAIAFWRSA